MTISGTPVAEVVMRVSMKRKEPLLWWPAIIGTLGWLAGLIAATFTARLAVTRAEWHPAWLVS